MCSLRLFTPTSKYFYTDISVISVTFRNSGGDDFSVRALIPQFSCASSNPLIGTNIMVVNIIIITVVVLVVVKFDKIVDKLVL